MVRQRSPADSAGRWLAKSNIIIMYIVISGVHGAGKTTLAKEVARRLGGIYLTETVDELVAPPQFGPKSKERLASQLWHSRQVLLKEKKILDDMNKYICDRGWADIYVYSRAILNEKERDLFFSIIDFLPKKLPDLHFIVHVEPEVLKQRIASRQRDNLENWGEDDQEYTLKINEDFVKFANDFKDLRPVYLIDIGGSVEENVEKILDIIKKHI